MHQGSSRYFPDDPHYLESIYKEAWRSAFWGVPSDHGWRAEPALGGFVLTIASIAAGLGKDAAITDLTRRIDIADHVASFPEEPQAGSHDVIVQSRSVRGFVGLSYGLIALSKTVGRTLTVSKIVGENWKGDARDIPYLQSSISKLDELADLRSRNPSHHGLDRLGNAVVFADIAAKFRHDFEDVTTRHPWHSEYETWEAAADYVTQTLPAYRDAVEQLNVSRNLKGGFNLLTYQIDHRISEYHNLMPAIRSGGLAADGSDDPTDYRRSSRPLPPLHPAILAQTNDN